MPDLPWTINLDACGLIDNSENGKEIVVLRDYLTCAIFNLGNGTWRDGPPLDQEELTYGSTVVQMNKNFVILGGRLNNNDVNNNTRSIYEFDEENYEWVRRSRTLTLERHYATGIAVPEYMVDCQ